MGCGGPERSGPQGKERDSEPFEDGGLSLADAINVSCRDARHDFITDFIRVAIRSVNEKCQTIQTMLDEIKASDCTQTLEQGFNRMDLHNTQQTAFRQTTQTSLAQLEHTIKTQCADIMAVNKKYQNNFDQHNTEESSFRQATQTSLAQLEHTLKTKCAGLMDALKESEANQARSKVVPTPTVDGTSRESLETTHATLRALELRLDTVHEVLVHVSKNAESAKTSLAAEEAANRARQTDTRLDMVYQTVQRMAKNVENIKPAPAPIAAKEEVDMVWYCHQCGDGPHLKWNAQCTAAYCGHQMCVYCNKEEKKKNEKGIWHCCNCGDGPIQKWNVRCLMCSHTYCFHCDR